MLENYAWVETLVEIEHEARKSLLVVEACSYVSAREAELSSNRNRGDVGAIIAEQ